jgi:hypothetical protein
MVARLHRGDTLANGLNDASTFMTKDDGECALRVFAGKRVGV